MAHQTFWLLLALVGVASTVFFVLWASALTRRRRDERKAADIRSDVADPDASAPRRPSLPRTEAGAPGDAD
ncbi:MAG: hypothetical protein U1C74_19585 [Phenylobacterium sp.]|nr:hypothetical protein [Phenylobacterium sp.]